MRFSRYYCWQPLTGPAQVPCGREQAHVAFTPDDFDILLCGNPAMIDSMIVWAEARGFTRASGDKVDTLHAEKCW